MASLNRCEIIGNLGKTPELKKSREGKSYCHFSVGVTSKGRDGKPETTWFNCTSFGETAELVAGNFSKGQPIHCEGPVKLDTFTDKGGAERSSLSLTAFQVEAVERTPAASDQPEQQAKRPASRPPAKKPAPPMPSDQLDLDHLPF